MKLSDMPLTGMEKFLLAWAIVVTLLLVAVAITVIWHDGSRELRRALVGALVLSAAMLAAFSAFAHEHGKPSLNPWYQQLKSGKGPCCDGSDYKPLVDVDWESKDGRYRVRIDGEWVDVPDDAVLKEPNEDGRTLVWPTWSDGKRTVRCFLPGAMT